MMCQRTISVVMMVLLGLPGVLLAEDTGPGCGLGKIIWGDSSHKLVQGSLASTTNNSFGSNTFGMSSGTSGCSNAGIVKNTEEVNVFVAVNFESIKEEVAQGHGEYLRSLAHLMQIPHKRQNAFFQYLQQQSPRLFPPSSTTPATFVRSLEVANQTFQAF